MNPDLAENLLRAVVREAAGSDFPDQLGVLRTLAKYKYDDYQQYAPGRQFIAYLAGWLNQFRNSRERVHALRFVQERLIFISDIEMRQLVNLMARDRVPSTLLRHVAGRLGIADHRIAEIRDRREFQRARRSSLFLGMSDGARIDQFRRNSDLSNEQFAMTHELNETRAKTMLGNLRSDLSEPDAFFKFIFLVDDFAGSGTTILRPDVQKITEGRLARFVRDTLPNLMGGSCPQIFIALYITTQQAVHRIESLIPRHPSPPWASGSRPQIISVMTIYNHSRLIHGTDGVESSTDHSFDALLHKYYDKSVEDEHKGNVLHGFADCGLPLVLTQNTPNNSLYLLWERTKTEPLFPRYERHQSSLEH